jgi:hypothetical protein
VVYLSPDADDALEDVAPGTVYVIGGIADLAARGVPCSVPKVGGGEGAGYGLYSCCRLSGAVAFRACPCACKRRLVW